MRRAILPALLLLACALPSSGQYGRYGGHGDREADRTVRGWYERFLGREPDSSAAGWVQGLQSGQDPEQLLAGILGSDEYYTRAGGTPRGFIQRLYLDLLTRRPTPREEDYWLRRMYHDSRTDVAHALLSRNAQSWDRDRGPDWPERHDYRRPVSRYR